MSKRRITIGGEEYEVAIERAGGSWLVHLREQTLEVRAVRLTDHEAELIVGDRRMNADWFAEGDRLHLMVDGERWTAEIESVLARPKARHREHSMTAPMPGIVLKISVTPGGVVSKGDPLIVLEAMKMEHQITAPHDGVVESLHCRVGDLVQPGVELITLEER
ncbi:MAG TPA: biotin/lipoyl-containing protein [Thermoanaerobaculia bacterium]|nr:biotin/lipoyl-containing protein [Thermoanaerobaculia bacterium]